jgi:hypothetical protein
MHHAAQSRQGGKGELHTPFADKDELPRLFLRVGECENQAHIDHFAKGMRCGPAVRPGNATQRADFFYGSTLVRATLLGGDFIKISGCLLFDLGFGCDSPGHG